MHFDAEFFVALGFVLFVLLACYYGAHRKLLAGLDGRAQKIKDELAEAEHLRQEASTLLASFEQKKIQAEADAQAIVAQARIEAEAVAKEAHERLADFIQRRMKQAEDKIALAEAQATADVKAAAADAAVKAAEAVLKVEAAGGFGEELITKGISDIKTALH
jgi:F-type H+-transporting ATPase subunit b